MNGSFRRRQQFVQQSSISSSIHKNTTSSSKHRRRYDVESLSRHYDRSRIEQELSALFSDDDDDDDEEEANVFFKPPPFAQRSSSSTSNKRRRQKRNDHNSTMTTSSSTFSPQVQHRNNEAGVTGTDNHELQEKRHDLQLNTRNPSLPPSHSLKIDEDTQDAMTLSNQETTTDTSTNEDFDNNILLTNSIKDKINELHNQMKAKIHQITKSIDQHHDQNMYDLSILDVNRNKEDEDFNQIQQQRQKQQEDFGTYHYNQEEEEEEEEEDLFSAMEEFSIIGQQHQERILPSSAYDRVYHQQKQQQQQEPPSLLMLSFDGSMSRHEEMTVTSDKSNLSYDDTPTITPSIAFFLSANKLPNMTDNTRKMISTSGISNIGINANDGLSIAADHADSSVVLGVGDCNDSQYYTASISPSTLYQSHTFSSHATKRNSVDMNIKEDESITVKGYSRGSSKYTTDSPRILDLREKKRLIERNHEQKYNRFPALIEVDRYF